MKREKLLIVNQHSSYITIDIANAFEEAGIYEKIFLMTGVVNVRENELADNVRLIKTIPYYKTNIFTRLFSWIVAFSHLILILFFRFRSYNLFLISNPPLISFLPYFCSNKYSVLIFDIYPDALVSNGFLTGKSFIVRLWQKANFKLYSRAERVFAISNGMKKKLADYCPIDKIRVVSLWSSFGPTLISKKDNEFIKKYALHDKFIIMYSGNMGRELGLELFLDVAKKLINDKNFLFIFIGEGWSFPYLKSQAKEMSLSNFMFFPYQEASILKHSLSSADLSIVSLPPSTASVSIPNKVYTLLAMARPIICISKPESELGKLIIENDVGRVFGRNDFDNIVSFIMKCRNEPDFLNKLSENAIKCAKLFSKENAKLLLT